MGQVDRNGNTLAHYAVMADDPRLIRNFFRWGMDVQAKNKLGQTPRDIALQRQKLNAAAELEQIEFEIEITRFPVQSV